MKFPESTGSAPLVGPSTDPGRICDFNQAKVDVVEKACWGLAKYRFWLFAMMPRGDFIPSYTPDESARLWELANGVFKTAKELFDASMYSEENDSERNLSDILPNLSRISIWKAQTHVSFRQALRHSGASILEVLRMEGMECARLYLNNTNLASPTRFNGMDVTQKLTQSPLFKAIALLSDAPVEDYEQLLISIVKPVYFFVCLRKEWDPHSKGMRGQPELALFLLAAFTFLKLEVTTWQEEDLIAKHLLPTTAIIMPVKMRQDLKEDVFDFYEVPVDLKRDPVYITEAKFDNRARFKAAAVAAAEQAKSGRPGCRMFGFLK